MNETVQTSVLVAGSVEEGGWYTESKFSQVGRPDIEGVVYQEYEISISSGTAYLDINSGHLILPNKIGCKPDKNYCYNSNMGHIFLKDSKSLSCDESKYMALYQGTGRISYGKDGRPTTVMVEETEITFGLTLTGSLRDCGHVIHSTEHPQLFIELESEAGFNRKVEVAKHTDLNLLNYVNSKFVYLDHKLQKQLTNLYDILQRKRCHLEQETVKNRLSMARTNPDEFAYAMNNQQAGTTALVKGEVVYIIKSIAKSVARRNTSGICYDEIPVTYNNEDYFLTPKNRLLMKAGTEIECSSVVPSGYKLAGHWISFSPKATRIVKPKTMSLIITGDWTYILSPTLVPAGIYTEADTNSFQRSLILPAESRARMATLVNLYGGRALSHQGGSVWNLMTPDDMKKMGSRALAAIMGGFREFGIWSSAVIGAISILTCVKAVVALIVRTITTICTEGFNRMLCLSFIPGAYWLLTIMHLRKKKTLADEILELPIEDLQKSMTNLFQQVASMLL